MINGLQLSTHMQLFNLKFPANASFLVRFLVQVATFDVIEIEHIWYFFEFPKKDSYNENFNASGYEYVHAIENLGTSVLLIQVYTLSCVICLILHFTKEKHWKIEKVYKR